MTEQLWERTGTRVIFNYYMCLKEYWRIQTGEEMGYYVMEEIIHLGLLICGAVHHLSLLDHN